MKKIRTKTAAETATKLNKLDTSFCADKWAEGTVQRRLQRVLNAPTNNKKLQKDMYSCAVRDCEKHQPFDWYFEKRTKSCDVRRPNPMILFPDYASCNDGRNMLEKPKFAQSELIRV